MNGSAEYKRNSIPEALSIGERALVLRAPGQVAEEVVVPDKLTPSELERYREQIRRSMGDPETEKATT